jgi:hypothetical protein
MAFVGHGVVRRVGAIARMTRPKLILDHPEEFSEELDFLVGKRVTLRLGLERSVRSQRANAYYWSTVIGLIKKETGQPEQGIHDSMCEMFLVSDKTKVEFVSKITGEVKEFTVEGRRSSKLAGEPFYEFVENVREWARDFLGIVTPDPDPDYWRKRLVKS